MLKEERQQIILSEVALHNRVLLIDLAEMLGVSIDTVRRDVKQLHTQKKLRKVHGGVLSIAFSNHNTRQKNIYALEDKIVIAKKAIKLIKNNSVILIHGGTTCLELARLIPENKKFTCFTLSLPVALELSKKPNVNIILIGGELYKDAKITIGSKAIRNLFDISVDYAFMGTGYVDTLHGLTEFDWDSVQVKKVIIKVSKKVVLLCISKKLNSHQRYKTCDLSEINTMITELDSDNSMLSKFKSNNINIL